MAAGLGDTGGQWGTLGAQTLPAAVGAAGVPVGWPVGSRWGAHTVPSGVASGVVTLSLVTPAGVVTLSSVVPSGVASEEQNRVVTLSPV